MFISQHRQVLDRRMSKRLEVIAGNGDRCMGSNGTGVKSGLPIQETSIIDVAPRNNEGFSAFEWITILTSC